MLSFDLLLEVFNILAQEFKLCTLVGVDAQAFTMLLVEVVQHKFDLEREE